MAKPENEFKSALAKSYPGMGGEMRRGIVGLAIRTFITPGEIAPLSAPPKADPFYQEGFSDGQKAAAPFTPSELLWIANAAGVDTGTSNIRPEPGSLTAEGLNALRVKLKGMVPCRPA